MKAQQQAANKRQEVVDLLEQNHLNMSVSPVLMARTPAAYRNKVIAGFAKDKNKKVFWGLYAPKSHRVVNTAGCPMQPEIINQILDEIASLVQSMKIELYSPKTRTGLLRHVLIRWAQNTGQIMVVFVTASRQFPSRKNMVNALREKFPQITTILQSVNSRDTSVVMENETQVLYGKGTITDELCGMKITFTPSSFYQIHHDQCEVLYNKARQLLDLNDKETVLDTYCGVGTIGMYLAQDCKNVVGVEINKEAIDCAKFNAKQNDISNIRFVAMDSTRFMQEAKINHARFDVIVLDPPRAGTTQEFIESACSLRPKKILYISCDPRTQIRDLRQFQRYGYKSKNMDLVDMFPNTAHIESVVLLEPFARRNPNPRVSNTKNTYAKPGRKPYKTRNR